MRTKWQSVLGLIAVLALFAAGCGSSEGTANEEAPAGDTATEESAGDEASTEGGGEDAAAGGDVSGTIQIDGSSTVGPLTDAIAEEYAAEAPDVTVNVGISGSGGGFERFCAGETDISNASRPIDEEEIATCEEAGIEFTEVRVGTDALTMVTNPQTDFLECLTTDEVISVFGPDGATTWDQVNPEFPAEPVTIFAPGADSGTYDFMVEDALGIEEPRQDYNASEDDNIIAQGVIGTPASWGFFGFAYFQESADQLKAIAYDSGDGCVEPSVETAQDDSYGLTRPLFIYVKNESLADPAVADFVTYYLDNVNSIIDSVGYIAAPDDVISQAQEDVQAAIEEAGGSTES